MIRIVFIVERNTFGYITNNFVTNNINNIIANNIANNTAKNVSDYYKNKEFQNDLKQALVYDDDMKSRYEGYQASVDKFNNAIKKYKPVLRLRHIPRFAPGPPKGPGVYVASVEPP